MRTLIVLCVCSLGAVACDDTPSPPSIDSLTMPDTATLDTATNTYLLKGTMTFHDPVATITTLEIVIPVDNKMKSVPINQSAGSVNPLIVQFDPTTPKGMQSYSIIILDSQMQSAEVDKTVTLQ